MTESLLEEARESLEAGEYRRAREAALAALADQPGDAALLRVAGRASAELGLDDAVELLEQATTADPADAGAWRDLGEALVYEGRVEQALAAFRRAVELRPDDTAALIDLGHTAFVTGRTDDAIASLRRASDIAPDSPTALRPLVDIYRRGERFEDALEAAQRLTSLDPEDVAAIIEVADLSLAFGRLDEAAAAFARLRVTDDDPEHEVYAFHGMIEVELRRGRWRRALDLAVDATRIDRLGRTTDVLAFIVAQVFGETDRPAPDRREIDEALARSRAEHRRLHAEALVA